MKAVSVLGIGLALLAACGGRGDKLTELPTDEKAAGEAVEVSVVQVHRQPITRGVVATGTSEPARVADLGPQLTGRINAILVREGDHVRAGDVLLHLDASEASLRVQQSAAAKAQARAQYELARAEYDRLAPLLQKGTITPQQLQRLEAQRDALKSAAEAAAIAQSDAQRVQGNTTIRAPFDGIISKVQVEVGEVATLMPPTVLARLVDLSSVDVRVQVHERELSRVAIGDRVSAKFPGSGESASGQVTFISPEIDVRTRNGEVVTRIPNPSGSLRAGMYAEISIVPKTSPNSLVIPTTAVGGTGDARYVFLVDNDGTVRRQHIGVAPIDGKLVEVIDGLSEGQVVVRDGLGRLSDGAAVRVQHSAELSAQPTAGESGTAEAKKPEGAKP